MTSHDCVHEVRKLLRIKSVGHSGTLDPQVQGVLNLYVGYGTKFIDVIKSTNKVYYAEFQLGYTSDTLDRWGILEKVPVGEIKEVDVRKAFESFLGKYEQIPPMVSAVKHKGRPLHSYAREGIEIKRKKRTVTIDPEYTLNFDEKTCSGSFTIRCSKGTYVRSFIDDLGKKLATRGIMTELTRLENDYVNISNTFTLDDIQKLAKEENYTFIKPLDTYLPFQRVFLNRKEYLDLYHGRTKTVNKGYNGESIILDFQGFQGIATWNGQEYIKERLIP